MIHFQSFFSFSFSVVYLGFIFFTYAIACTYVLKYHSYFSPNFGNWNLQFLKLSSNRSQTMYNWFTSRACFKLINFLLFFSFSPTTKYNIIFSFLMTKYRCRPKRNIGFFVFECTITQAYVYLLIVLCLYMNCCDFFFYFLFIALEGLCGSYLFFSTLIRTNNHFELDVRIVFVFTIICKTQGTGTAKIQTE